MSSCAAWSRKLKDGVLRASQIGSSFSMAGTPKPREARMMPEPGGRRLVPIGGETFPPVGANSWIAAEAAFVQRLEIGGPQLVLTAAQFVEIGPGIDAAVVEIVKADADGVVADRFYADDPDMAPAGDDLLLTRSMALDLGRWAF